MINFCPTDSLILVVRSPLHTVFLPLNIHTHTSVRTRKIHIHTCIPPPTPVKHNTHTHAHISVVFCLETHHTTSDTYAATAINLQLYIPRSSPSYLDIRTAKPLLSALSVIFLFCRSEDKRRRLKPKFQQLLCVFPSLSSLF